MHLRSILALVQAHLYAIKLSLAIMSQFLAQKVFLKLEFKHHFSLYFVSVAISGFRS